MLKQAMAEVSRGGLNLRANQGDQSWAVIGATRILIDMLSGHSPTRASKAAEWAHQFFETSLKKNATEVKVACAQGCAFCCYYAVSALAPEVFLVANAVRAQHPHDFDSAQARIRAVEQITRGLNGLQRAQKRIACAFLVDNLCTVYSARPSPCRGMSSVSVKICERGFKGESVGIPTPQVWTSLRSAELQAMWAALTAVDLPSDSYELNEAVSVALEQPNAEARWLKGEDIFARVNRMRIDSPEILEHNKKIIANLVAGATGKEIPNQG